ncbi:MAG: hypothetical protein FGM54_01770 [Chitinophagaceae bacterium]|nr:hypothetical protein [Chitinophagaceae bacterium]
MKQNYLTEAIHLINMLVSSKTFFIERERYDNIFSINLVLNNKEYAESLFGVNPNLSESKYLYFDIYKIDNSDDYTLLIENKFKYDNLNDTDKRNDNLFGEDFNQIRNNGIFDLLGKYILRNGVDNEGEIIIYQKAILKYSELLQAKNFPDKSPADIYEALFKIVLWHEMGHWASHWLEDKKNNRWDNQYYKYVRPEDKDLHEGLAQAFTYWAIMGCNTDEYLLLSMIFNSLTLSQPKQYKTYHQIISKTKDFNKFLDAITEIRSLNFVPRLDNLLSYL